MTFSPKTNLINNFIFIKKIYISTTKIIKKKSTENSSQKSCSDKKSYICKYLYSIPKKLIFGSKVKKTL